MRLRLIVVLAAIIVVVFASWAILNLRAPSEERGRGEMVSLSKIKAEAARLESQGSLLEAKTLYKQLVDEFPGSPQVGDWEEKIWDLNIKLLFSPALIPGRITYEIKPADTLAKIAKKFNTTVELLKKSNALATDTIIVGRELNVWTKPFSIVVSRSQNFLMLKSNEEVFKAYIVSTGKEDSTPLGTFKIINKLVDPVWYKEGAIVPPESPDNILGTRWMGFDLTGYGIHGTTEPETLGQPITQGCVRMSNSDVEELFAIVPVGTQVTIVN